MFKCKIGKCKTHSRLKKGLCYKHYRRLRFYGDPLGNPVIKSVKERYWEKVKKGAPDDCWPWLGSKSGNFGHGRFSINRHRGTTAHRYGWILAHGDIPEGKFVCHKCDNPSCVNPDHLFLGTHKDNMQDMVKKNRCNKPIGDKHHNSKVNPDIVRHIRKKEMQQRAYAKLYGLCQRTVAEIQKKLTWKHVADQPEIGSEGRDQ